MKNNLYRSLSMLLFVAFCNTLFSQIWYKLDLMDDGETYQISLVSEENWSLPYNLTSTGQVTIKVPTLEFDIAEFESVHPLLIWEYNSRTDAPDEDLDLDFLSFGLKNASREFEYEAGEEIPIIRFQNIMGCTESISLLDNEVDPLKISTTREASVGNQLIVLGAHGNAYIGNKNSQKIKCKKLIKAKQEVTDEVVIYPNPASNEVNLKLNWIKETQVGHFLIRDNSGRVVLQKKAEIQKGLNNLHFNIGQLDGGIYHLELSNSNYGNISLDQFAKIYSASIETIPVDEDNKSEHKNPRN